MKLDKIYVIGLIMLLSLSLILCSLLALKAALYRPTVDTGVPFTDNIPLAPTPELTVSKNTQPTDETSAPVPDYVREKDKYLFLVVGVDKASGRGDAILLASFDVPSGKISVMQIPRDTYINKTVGGYASLTRVNAIFSAEYNSQISKGISAKTAKTLAMQDLQKRLSEALCINIDAFSQHFHSTLQFLNIIVCYHSPKF